MAWFMTLHEYLTNVLSKRCIELINSLQNLRAVHELNCECSQCTFVNVLCLQPILQLLVQKTHVCDPKASAWKFLTLQKVQYKHS